MRATGMPSCNILTAAVRTVAAHVSQRLSPPIGSYALRGNVNLHVRQVTSGFGAGAGFGGLGGLGGLGGFGGFAAGKLPGFGFHPNFCFPLAGRLPVLPVTLKKTGAPSFEVRALAIASRNAREH